MQKQSRKKEKSERESVCEL